MKCQFSEPWNACRLSALAIALFLSSCAVGPDYKRPTVSSPAEFKSTVTAAEKATPAIPSQWWTLFNDTELNGLAEKALAANQDIKAAVARVDETRASVRIARGDYFPSVSLSPSARRGRSAGTSFSDVTGSTAPRGRISTTYSLPLTLDYEFDFFGRIRRQVEDARYTALASQSDLIFVQQTAVADVAQAYFSIRLYDTQIVIYVRALELFRKQLELTQTKFKAGLSVQTDVLQAETLVNSGTAQLAEVRRLRAREEHAIAVLIGLSPAEFALEPKELSTPIPTIPVGLPATLLNQRPDVATAERRLASANAQIGVATAAFYPSFSLTGSAGYESDRTQNLLAWSNRVWSIGPSLNLPIFQGGRLSGTLAERRAAYQELVANYRAAVLTAYRDVEDELSDLHLFAEKSAALNATVAYAREYARLTELQYRQGITAYLQVIDANQTLLNNELAAAQTQNQQLAASVLLIKALGGGWSIDAKNQQ